MCRRLVFYATLFCLLALPLAYAGFDDGEAAYEKGDYTTAYKEFKCLAEQGHAGAQFSLGVMYELGNGVPQDDQEALRWYLEAAQRGNVDAQHNLGYMYAKGQGVVQNYAEAFKWYGEAADRGNAFAQNALGWMYRSGQGIPQDFVLAHMWFNLAAAQGSSDAEGSRDKLAKEMTPDQVAEAQRLASEWKPKGK